MRVVERHHEAGEEVVTERAVNVTREDRIEAGQIHCGQSARGQGHAGDLDGRAADGGDFYRAAGRVFAASIGLREAERSCRRAIDDRLLEAAVEQQRDRLAGDARRNEDAAAADDDGDADVGAR
ncbi:MAG TPA: hypothetical protein VGH63_01345 [Polyangia bacterium]